VAMQNIENVQDEQSPEQGRAHVDVIKNEWLAGYQVVVARVRVSEAGEPEVDAGEPVWGEFVSRVIESRKGFDLSALHEAVHGDYVFATEPHGDTECPFHAMVIPLTAVESREAAAV
jgi:hypothetical protein